MSLWEEVIRSIGAKLAADAIKWAASRLLERFKSMMVRKEQRRPKLPPPKD